MINYTNEGNLTHTNIGRNANLLSFVVDNNDSIGILNSKGSDQK
jgi:hypothetical protein